MTQKPLAQKATSNLPSVGAFCLTVPLYKEFTFDNEKGNPFYMLQYYEGTLDCHCMGCGRHSVFNRTEVPGYADRSHFRNYVFTLWFACSRDPQHKLSFVFRAHEGLLQKIGQFPSLADLSTPDLQKYRPVLGDERYRELARGIGLATHGVGAGAFVYLRRIFESLIEDARTVAAISADWDQANFDRSRMDEKIAILKPFLPPFLVENRSLYGILSVGVHTLPEADCLAAFPVVRLGIELILDDQLEKHEREQKIRHAKNSIAALGGALKNGAAT